MTRQYTEYSSPLSFLIPWLTGLAAPYGVSVATKWPSADEPVGAGFLVARVDGGDVRSPVTTVADIAVVVVSDSEDLAETLGWKIFSLIPDLPFADGSPICAARNIGPPVPVVDKTYGHVRIINFDVVYTGEIKTLDERSL